MSGHSKWSTIKRQKGRTDAARGQEFTKLANAITLAVRDGGGNVDPEFNFKLRLAMDKARGANMPKENIERAVRRAQGKQEGEFHETTYEGFAPGGVAIIIEAATDNPNRTTSEVKNLIEKNGGTMGSPGAVAYQFEQKGLITVIKNGKSFDEVFLVAADSGAEDVEDSGIEALIYTKPEDLKKVKDELSSHGILVHDAEIIRKPINTVTISNLVIAQKVASLIEKAEAHDDVQKIYSNVDFPDEIISQLSES